MGRAWKSCNDRMHKLWRRVSAGHIELDALEPETNRVIKALLGELRGVIERNIRDST